MMFRCARPRYSNAAISFPTYPGPSDSLARSTVKYVSTAHRVLAAFNALPTNHFARKPLPSSDVKSFFDDPDRALSKNFPYMILRRFSGLRALVRNMTYLERQKATGEYGHRGAALGGTTGLSPKKSVCRVHETSTRQSHSYE